MSEFLKQLDEGIAAHYAESVMFKGYKVLGVIIKGMLEKSVETRLCLLLHRQEEKVEVNLSCRDGLVSAEYRRYWIFKNINSVDEALQRLIVWGEDNLKY